MFGTCRNGALVANTLFFATTPGSGSGSSTGTTASMATVRVNQFALSPSNVRVLEEGRLITDVPTLLVILEHIECDVIQSTVDISQGGATPLTRPALYISSRP
jgi:hypothetical protein